MKVPNTNYFYIEYNNEAKEHIHTSYPSEAHAELKQIVRPQHTEVFLQFVGTDWGRKEGARDRDGKG